MSSAWAEKVREGGDRASVWCEACQEHYEFSHYDKDGRHGVGPAYGWVGAGIAREQKRQRALESILRLTENDLESSVDILDGIREIAQEALDA